MATTKQTVLHVRLSDAQDQAIAAIESRYGGRSELVRLALDRFLAEAERREAMSEFVDAWVADVGPSSAAELAEMDRFFAGSSTLGSSSPSTEVTCEPRPFWNGLNKNNASSIQPRR